MDADAAIISCRSQSSFNHGKVDDSINYVILHDNLLASIYPEKVIIWLVNPDEHWTDERRSSQNLSLGLITVK